MEKKKLKRNREILAAAAAIGLLLFFGSCSSANSYKSSPVSRLNASMQQTTDTITLGAGCFWCVEAVFQNLEGVEMVLSGYSGGFIKNPAYKEVCAGTTGHAEVCQIIYHKNKITLAEILEVFWKTHDPTSLNRQGNDVGTQYRSVIFYHNQEQKQQAEELKKKLNESGAYDKAVVTEISPYTTFYKAEDYHQNYYNNNGDEPYCRMVIQPKIDKFKAVFRNKLKQ